MPTSLGIVTCWMVVGGAVDVLAGDKVDGGGAVVVGGAAAGGGGAAEEQAVVTTTSPARITARHAETSCLHDMILPPDWNVAESS